MDSKTRESFIDNLLNKQRQHHVMTYIKYFDDEDNMIPDTLLNLLSSNEHMLNEGGKTLIKYLENSPAETSELSYENFKWKLTAFLSIQDVFDMKGQPDVASINQQNLLKLRYFYYESKYILTESIISSLNGSHIGNKHLMRTFLEFNLMQNYFIRENDRRGSFKPINDYFDKNRNPSISNLINKAIPEDSFCKPIKKRFQIELESISKNYSHPYDPQKSPKHSGGFLPSNTLESIYFWIHWSIILDMVLWLYFVNYPTLFFPVDITRKFGFNRPMGLFVDESVGRIIKKSISDEDFALFKKYAGEQSAVESILDFYNNQKELNDDEIWETWTEETKPSTLREAYILNCVQMRVMQEAISIGKPTDEREVTESEGKIIQYLNSFSKWEKIYKKIR